MCVIIFIPKGETITKQELQKAWRTNPDGAGYSMRTTDIKTGKEAVMFHRGFMEFGTFYDEIKNKIGKQDIVLHFRITTSNQVNKLQCHPYKKGNVYKLKGITHQPVLAMNGIISNGQPTYKGLNDTMSFIMDNQEALKIISKSESQELIDLLEDATSCRWSIMLPNTVLLSHGFVYRDGKYYSNTNHLDRSYYYCSDVYSYTTSNKKSTNSKTYTKLIKKSLRKQLAKTKNYNLLCDVEDYIEFHCKFDTCEYCITCLEDCKTISDLKEKLNFVL